MKSPGQRTRFSILNKYYDPADSDRPMTTLLAKKIFNWLLRALGISLKTNAKKKAQPFEITP